MTDNQTPPDRVRGCSMLEELFAIVKCTKHEDDALDYLTKHYDALRAALGDKQ